MTTAQRNTDQRFAALQAAVGVWADATFGAPPQRGPVPALQHLSREALEAAADPGDIVEYADCLMVWLDAVRRAGWTLDEVLTAAWVKQAENLQREYGEPDADGVIEHVR